MLKNGKKKIVKKEENTNRFFSLGIVWLLENLRENIMKRKLKKTKVEEKKSEGK